jgi:hypothetical protein
MIRDKNIEGLVRAAEERSE